MFKLFTWYDGKLEFTHQFSDALEAFEAFARCKDHGFANEYATYNFSEPSGKMHTKIFYRDGKVGGK